MTTLITAAKETSFRLKNLSFEVLVTVERRFELHIQKVY